MEHSNMAKTMKMKCDWCGKSKDEYPNIELGFACGRDGKLFQCSGCLDKEMAANKAARLKKAPIESDLIERGYEQLKNHGIYPCEKFTLDGQEYEEVVDFDSPKANVWHVVYRGRTKKVFKSCLEDAFQFCLKEENLV